MKSQNSKNANILVILVLHTCIGMLGAGLNELCEQIDFYEKRPLIDCLRYDDYGCWCGPGGSGPPVDSAGKLNHNKILKITYTQSIIFQIGLFCSATVSLD